MADRQESIITEQVAVLLASDFLSKEAGHQFPVINAKFIRGVWLVSFDSGWSEDLGSLHLVSVDPLSRECHRVHT